MKKISKKIFAAFMAMVLIVATAATAFAVTPDMAAAGTYGATNQVLTEGVNLKKSIVFINPDDKAVYEPNITFNYAVSSPASVTATVTDANNRSAAVKPGPAGGLSVAPSVSFSASNDIVAATAAGYELSKNIALSVDLSAFQSAGVYRYKISESVASADLAAAGLLRSENYVSDRYVDVYIKNDNDALAVYGFSCFEGNDNTSLTSESTNKSAGFVQGSDLNDVDVYYTYNVSVKKVIDGTLADMLHSFPFSISVTGSDNAAKYQYKLADANANTDALVGGAAIEQALGHNKQIEIYGLPATANIAVSETNNTADSYSVVISNDMSGAVKAYADAIAAGGSAALSDAAVAVTDYSAAVVASVAASQQKYGAIRFTNSLDAVSPTGVVVRFMPYALMFGMAFYFFFVTKRDKKEEEQTAAL